MPKRLSEDLREKRRLFLESHGRYYKVLVNGETVGLEPSIDAARDYLLSAPLQEGDKAMIRYSQVPGQGTTGWHEPNYEAYIYRDGELSLTWKKGRKDSPYSKASWWEGE